MTSFLKRFPMYPKAIVFVVYTLTYNAFKSNSPLADCAFEPVFWLVDHFAGLLGRALVVLVVCLISTVVLIFYVYVVPLIVFEYNLLLMVCHLVCGHWLLLNITFHYYKAVSTSPGYPPSGKQVLSIIKNATYQVCTKSWINNCVGQFNHRYFFLFCVYMFLGTVYVSVTIFPNFLDHLDIHAKNVPVFENKEPMLNAVVFEFMLCFCVSLTVGALALWHAILISRGETSIESYINKSKRKQMKKEGCQFLNPYHYGFWNNWRMLLGLFHGRGIWTIILPSSHLPRGDGIIWPQLSTSHENHYFTGEKDEEAFMA